MDSQRVHAVVVRVADHGDTHQVVELLTREGGLKAALAPGAKASRRRFSGALIPGNRLWAVLRRSNGRALPVLLEASVEGGLCKASRSSLSAMLQAGWMLDLSRTIVSDEQAHPEIHDLLLQGLEMLDEGRFNAWSLVAFEVAALVAFGVAPRFDACSRCEREPSAEASRFSPIAGGLLCPTCSPGWKPGEIALTRATLRALQCLTENGAKQALQHALALPEAPDQSREARTALGRCTEHLLGRPLKSRELLDRLGSA